MNKFKNLKIKKLIKFSLVPTIAIPSLAVISCGTPPEPLPIRVQWEQRAANHQPNMWVDGYINKYSDNMYASWTVPDHKLKLAEGFRHENKAWWLPHKNSRKANVNWTYMLNYQNAIKGNINPAKYSRESLKKDFKFESKDLSNEIHAFIKNYIKFDFHSNILGYYAQEDWKNVGGQAKEDVIIMNSDGEHRNSPGNSLPGVHLFDKKGLTNYEQSSNDNSNYFNVRIISFNQAMFHFNPVYAVLDPFYKIGTLMNEDYQYNLKSDYITNHKNMIEQIFSKLKLNKNYDLYHGQFLKSYHPDDAQPFEDLKLEHLNLTWPHLDLTWYGALKIMMENLDLKPSEVFEVVSSGFAKINAIRKSMLVKKLNDSNMNVYIDGSTDSSDQDLESVILEPSILNNVNRIFMQSPKVSKALPQTWRSWSGRYGKPWLGQSDLGEDSIEYIRNYLRLKYGSIERLQGLIDNIGLDKFKKVRIRMLNSSNENGFMTKYEADFYDNNKLNVKWANYYKEMTKEEYVSEVMGISDVAAFLNAKPSYTADLIHPVRWSSQEDNIRRLFDRNVH